MLYTPINSLGKYIMAINYTIHSAQEHVHVIGTGELLMPEMIAIVDAIAEDPAFEPSFNIIFDLLNGNYTAELRDGDDFVKTLNRRMPDFQNKFALIVPPHLHVIAKLYSVLAAVGGFDRMKCFLSLDDAFEWCGIEQPPSST